MLRLEHKPQQWDTDQTSSTFLSLEQFIYYVLAPFVATWFISDDLDVDLNPALAILYSSSDFGDLFNNELPAPSAKSVKMFAPKSEGKVFRPKPLMQNSPISSLSSTKPTDTTMKSLATRSPAQQVKTTTMTSFPEPVIKKKTKDNQG
ncbi:hypothetical protein K438DRAFT_1779997 [Mycena galopus ATCC 62051]|nr:hypothetical protein K438DRAFT_1779997 [Mycena galopus ATCC 62051]